ncbi:MAG: DUF3467 domain-containing protein [Patescibacteria group bacterium]
MTEQQIQIKATDEQLKGGYSNAVQVTHSKEEFVLDFMNIFPWQKLGLLIGRILLSPSHAKRLAAALQDNVKRYEEQHGEIEVGNDKLNQQVGFKTE